MHRAGVSSAGQSSWLGTELPSPDSRTGRVQPGCAGQCQEQGAGRGRPPHRTLAGPGGGPSLVTHLESHTGSQARSCTFLGFTGLSVSFPFHFMLVRGRQCPTGGVPAEVCMVTVFLRRMVGDVPAAQKALYVPGALQNRASWGASSFMTLFPQICLDTPIILGAAPTHSTSGGPC